MVIFFFGTLGSAIMEGGGGFNATRLAIDHNAVVTDFTVMDTSGFLKADYFYCGDEKVKYTNKDDTTFENCVRGYDGTEAVDHSAGAKVYSREAEVLNSALGFNLASTGATVGEINIPIVLGNLFTTTLPRVVLWDYAWLKEGLFQYLRYFFMFITIGFIVYMCFMIASALGGILQGIFKRG